MTNSCKMSAVLYEYGRRPFDEHENCIKKACLTFPHYSQLLTSRTYTTASRALVKKMSQICLHTREQLLPYCARYVKIIPIYPVV